MDREQAIISAVINTPNCLSRVNLEPSDFSDTNCQQIWSAITAISRKEQIDLINISEWLKNETGYDWVKTVASIARTVATPTNIENYCERVKADALQRKARSIFIQAAHSEEPNDIQKIITDLMALTKEDKNHVVTMQEAIEEAFTKIEEAYYREGVPGRQTGFESLDEYLGGYHDSDLIVIGGRPAMGKTAMMVTMINNCAAKGFFVSSEMARDQVGSRVISSNSRVPATRLRNGVHESDFAAMSSAAASYLKTQCLIYDKPGPTIEEVVHQARIAKLDKGIEVVYVDYIQKIRSRSKSNRVDEIEDVVMGLKDLARELQVPVIALAQLNRECEKRNDKRPMMSDLKGAGAIEQEADAIAFLYRDIVYNEQANENDAELIFEKNRHGPTGTIPMHFDPKTMKFSDHGGW